MSRLIVKKKCTGCGQCLPSCRKGAIQFVSEFPGGYGKKTAKVLYQKCTLCGVCVEVCPHHAIVLVR
ncbi:MAG: hypothetical protein B6I37_08795 [Desulfobacteraceae bacterium 4572_35.2]|nr:MAG: hypothetical protein B6I37_08795 [Desulfobacteraceae bacterium 4572_35.2]